MKVKIISIVLILISQIAVYGCLLKESSSISDDIRSTENFTNIELKTFANVFLTQGDIQEIKIDGEENVIANITTVIKNGTLIITNSENISDGAKVNIYITVKELSSIDLSGSGNIEMKNQFKSDHLILDVSGSGEIKAIVDAKSLKMVMSGSGNIIAKGRSAESDINISGSGNVDGKDLQTFTSSINISGSGTSTVDVNNELTVNITGSGNVFYISDPERIHSKINGSGKIEKIAS